MKNNIRFEILKRIKIAPTHGYDLYSTFSMQNLVKDPSQLYKIIRSMKKQGLLYSVKEKSKHGYEKEILSLSPLGLQTYYEHVSNYAKQFINLVEDANVLKYTKIIYNRLHTFNPNLFKNNNLIFLLDYRFVSIQRLLTFLIPFFKSLENNPKIFLNLNKKIVNKPPIPKLNCVFKIIDTNSIIEPNSIDVIISLGNNTENFMSDKLFGIDSWIKKMKSDGVLFFSNFKKEKNQESDRSYLITSILEEIFTDFPKNYREQFIKEFDIYQEMAKNSIKKLNNSEIIKGIQEVFFEVDYSNIGGILDIVIAQKPKKSKI
ncbi:MAG: PadR family transcriptional regulator [archaeon]|nr:PadR family transcriptional regulator [archaeon]